MQRCLIINRCVLLQVVHGMVSSHPFQNLGVAGDAVQIKTVLEEDVRFAVSSCRAKGVGRLDGEKRDNLTKD